MALTDVIFYEVVASVNRGNTGTVEDTTASHHTLFVTIPAITDVKTGVIYGLQNNLTGTLTGSGGGPTYYAYG